MAKRSLPTFGDILVLDKLITGPIVNLMYWAGLAMIVLLGFGVVGAAIGLAIREGDLMGWILTLPTMAFGFLIVVVLVAIWRGFCEFYLVVFRIAEDLRALRQASEAEAKRPAPPSSSYFPPNP